MNRQEMITALVPSMAQLATVKTEAKARVVLETMSTPELEILYSRQQATGAITTTTTAPLPQVTAQEIEAEAIRQQAREIRRQAALQERQQIITSTLFYFGAVIQHKALVDCASNRQQLASFLNPGEQVNNPVLWLKKVLADNPSLIQKLAWADPPMSKQKLAEAAERDREYSEKQLPADREKFRLYCFSQELDRRDITPIAFSEANLTLLRSLLGAGLKDLETSTITTLGRQPYLLTSDGETHELVPATPEDIAWFRREKEELRKQYVVDQEQARVEHLKKLSREGNISELRRIARKEAGTPQPETNNLRQLEFEFSLLKAYVERESTMPVLEEVWQGRPITLETIQAEGPEFLHQLLRTFGRCQVDRVLHGLGPDFFANASQKLEALEQQLGLRRAADFTRDEVREALQTRNQI
jgi:hypothetical protein